MNEQSSKQDLQNALKLMNRCDTSNLAESIKSANSLIIRALYDADVEYFDTSSFITDYMNLYAPLDAKVKENHHAVQDEDVKRWVGTINLVVSHAKSLCEEPC